MKKKTNSGVKKSNLLELKLELLEVKESGGVGSTPTDINISVNLKNDTVPAILCRIYNKLAESIAKTGFFPCLCFFEECVESKLQFTPYDQKSSWCMPVDKFRDKLKPQAGTKSKKLRLFYRWENLAQAHNLQCLGFALSDYADMALSDYAATCNEYASVRKATIQAAPRWAFVAELKSMVLVLSGEYEKLVARKTIVEARMRQLKVQKRALLDRVAEIIESGTGQSLTQKEWNTLCQGQSSRIKKLFKARNITHYTLLTEPERQHQIQRAWARAILAIPSGHNKSGEKLRPKHSIAHSLKDDGSLQQLYGFFNMRPGLKKLVGCVMARYVSAPPLICTDADSQPPAESDRGNETKCVIS